MLNQCIPIKWEDLTDVLFDDGIVIETGEINLEEIENVHN